MRGGCHEQQMRQAGAIQLPVSAPGQDALAPYDPSNPRRMSPAPQPIKGSPSRSSSARRSATRIATQYQLDMLYQPGKPWAPWSPQRQWNHKVLIMHGFDCHGTYGVTTAVFADGITSTVGQTMPSVAGQLGCRTRARHGGDVHRARRLGRQLQPGASSRVDRDGQGRVVNEYGADRLHDRYRLLRRVAGRAVDGKRLPGLYQGLIPQCSFPDAGSSGQQIVDYEALGNYFTDATKSDPTSWNVMQEAEVEGTGEFGAPTGTRTPPSRRRRSSRSRSPQLHRLRRRRPLRQRQQVYNAQTNPGGVRCGLLDWDINLLGPQGPARGTRRSGRWATASPASRSATSAPSMG